MTVKINERFKPDPSFKTLYYIYVLITVLILLLLAVIIIMPISYLRLGFATIVTFFFSVICLLIVVYSIIWINLYYTSIFYSFTENEIVIEKGVWWKHRHIIPYNRITNIDIYQGPLSRILGLWELRIQTAGYHTAPGSAGIAEALLQGIKNVEELRDFILDMVRKYRPVSVEAGAEAISPKLGEQILAELKKIREALEIKR